jgi:hypothetical protein
MPARWRWLRDRLTQWPLETLEIQCPAFQAWRKHIGAGHVSLVFSSYYANNPASMFGHTFLVLRRRPGQASILDDSISFVGIPDTDNPLFYAIKGVLGLFDGRLMMQPYYIKIQEYNNADRRDLWEYELQLSNREIDFLQRVLWEVGPYPIPYRYFDQNCSSLLLKILATALPTRDLSNNHPWTIPSDTLRVVYRNPGLVSRVIHRPSNLRQFLLRYRQLPPQLQKLVEEIVHRNDVAALGILATLTADNQAFVLDTVVDFTDYKERLAASNTPKIYGELRKAALTTRAGLAVSAPSTQSGATKAALKIEEKAISKERPDDAPSSARMGLKVGHSKLNGRFLEAQWRPALKDLEFPQLGFAPGLAIEFFKVTARYHIDHNEPPFLSSLMLFSITSLPALEAIVNAPSFSLDIGAETLPGCDTTSFGCIQGFVRGQRGVSTRWQGVLAYGLLGGQGSIRSHRGFPLFVGPLATAGTVYDLSPQSRVTVEVVRSRQFAATEFREDLQDFDYGQLGWSYRVTTNTEVRLSSRWQRDDVIFGGSWSHYY